MVVKIAVGPSAPPIIPSEAASFGVKPIKMATSNTVKMPNCAAAPKIESRRLRSIGPKSVRAPTPIKIIGGRKPVFINIQQMKFIKPRSWAISCNGISQIFFITPFTITMPFSSAWTTPISPPGKLASNTPKAIGISNNGSYFFLIPR